MAEKLEDGEVQLTKFTSLARAREVICAPGQGPAKIAFEAGVQTWAWARWLKEAGHEPIIVDTFQISKIGIGVRQKYDELDAQILLEALCANRLPQAHLLSDHRQQLRQQLVVRAQLVEARAHFVTSMRQLIRDAGESIKSCGAEYFGKAVKESALSKATRALIAPLLEAHQIITLQIVMVDKKLDVLSKEEPAAELLCTVPGVGSVLSAAFVSVVDDPRRFKKAHDLELFGSRAAAKQLGRQRTDGAHYQGWQQLSQIALGASGLGCAALQG